MSGYMRLRVRVLTTLGTGWDLRRLFSPGAQAHEGREDPSHRASCTRSCCTRNPTPITLEDMSVQEVWVPVGRHTRHVSRALCIKLFFLARRSSCVLTHHELSSRCHSSETMTTWTAYREYNTPGLTSDERFTVLARRIRARSFDWASRLQLPDLVEDLMFVEHVR